jgi:CheY-like chemotaxis protein
LLTQKVQILIVDDELDLLNLYSEIFEDNGYQVFSERSALAAMEIYKNNKDIKLIISDSKMFGMSGLDFLRALKETNQKIPLFYLSTGDANQSEEELKSLGGHRLVLKPFDVNEILINIKLDLIP